MMVLGALEKLGGQKWLVKQAKAHPQAFMQMLRQVMPTQVVGDVTHRFVAEMPPPEDDPNEWLKTLRAEADARSARRRGNSRVAAAVRTAGRLRDLPGLRDLLRRRARLAQDRGHARRLAAALARLRRGRGRADGAPHRASSCARPSSGEAAVHPARLPSSGHTITSPQGARLRFAYLERDADAENYQGDNNTRVYVEELGNFPNPAPVMKLMATLRSTKGVPVGFRGTGNPGGPGHGWVKARYISPAPQGWKVIEEPFTNPWTGEVVMKQRIFIPGRITDHDLLGPEYIANLQMSGSPELVRAWLEGDWDVVAGAYFPEFSRGRHVLEPLEFPKDWRRFTATDWGSARPFWTGWFVIVQREMQARTVTGAR
jgi:hypothetical protein